MAMTPDTRSILTSLRFMKDSELQQYAAMHKNDPFIFPLAFQESQMRKQVRAEEQAKQQQPQAKVVDQNLAAMAAEPLPEDVGIAQLPANNLQGIATGAAGGIVAFDEGGEVPRFNGLGGSFVGPPSPNSIQEFLRHYGLTSRQYLEMEPAKQAQLVREFDAYRAAGTASQAAPAATAATSATAARTPTATESGIKAINNALSGAGNYLKRGLGAFAKYSPAAMVGEGLFNTSPEELAILRKADQARLGKATGDVLSQYGIDGGMASPAMSAADVNATMGIYAPPPAWASGEGQATGNKGAAPGGQGGPRVPPGPATPQVAMPQMPTAPTPSLASAKELAGQLLDTGAYKKSIEDYQKAEQDAVDAARLARKEGKPEGKAYEEYEKTLRDETADLGKRKSEAQGEAWLTAGLAVLGGSSPYALQNLSLATKGVDQYRDAMKDIRKATRENAKGLADIAQARRAEERGDWEKTQEFEERASTRMSNARKFGVEGIMGLGVKNAELAGRAYDTQIQQAGALERTMIQERGATARTNAQIAAQIAAYNAPGAQEKLFTTLGGGDPVAGLGVYAKAMGPGARDDSYNRAKAFHDWSTSLILQKQYPDFNNYYKMQFMGGPTIGGASGASTGNWGTATVVPQPGR